MDPFNALEEAYFAGPRNAETVRRYRAAKAVTDELASRANDLLNAVYSAQRMLGGAVR